MRPVLALDTATARATLAAGVPGAAAVDLVVAEKRELSRAVDAAAREVLRAAGFDAADVGAVIVADGPGSFTGLRIGIAFAKGFSRAAGIPLLSAPSLLGAARAVLPGPGEAVAEYDALRGDVYRAIYRFAADGSVTVVLPPTLMPADVTTPSAATQRATETHASAAALVRLAGAPGGVSPVADPAAWEPTYGRPAEAEARRLAAHVRRPLP